MPAYGIIKVDKLALREGSAADSPVVAKVKIVGSYYIFILDATPNALHVNLHLTHADALHPAGDKEKEEIYVGWTDWGSVVPQEALVILDAETGAVVTRRPLGYMWTPVTYSPDGTRAVFNGPSTIHTKCEVRTSDYANTRCVDLGDSGFLFYGPADGALYAALQQIGGRYAGDTATRLKIVRIGDESASDIAAEIPDDVGDFAISPDGRTGFYLHHSDYRTRQMRVDVVDLATFTIRNSFTLRGDNLGVISTRSGFAVNQDGTELYADLKSVVGKVSVIDTRTGGTRRVLKFRHAPRESWYISSDDVIGDSLLLGLGRGGHDEPHPTFRRIWLKRDGRVVPEKRFETVFQAGSYRYALNTKSGRLFKLDAKNNVRESFQIDLSSLPKGSADNLSIQTLSLSPDGKRILLFVISDHRAQ
jgi:DNA-binding beta-propeller fold protein YncE